MLEIKGFLETSFLDWPGKICSVLFLPGCNLRCPYCHNHALVLHPDRVPTFPLKSILSRLRSFRGWIDGVCITGGEPTLHPDLLSLVRKIKDLGFPVKLDTNGSNPGLLDRLIAKRAIDFVSRDVKAPVDPVQYSRAAGLPVDLDRIWKSTQILKRGDVAYGFRTTVVPGLHTADDILRLGQQLRPGARMTLQDFNPENPMDPALREIRPYGPEKLRELERAIRAMN